MNYKEFKRDLNKLIFESNDITPYVKFYNKYNKIPLSHLWMLSLNINDAWSLKRKEKQLLNLFKDIGKNYNEIRRC